MENVGDREVVLKGRYNQDERGQQDDGEHGNPGSAGCLAHAFRTRSGKSESEGTCQERIGTQSECKDKRKTPDQRHW